MADEAPPVTRIFITTDVLNHGAIREVYAEIQGDIACWTYNTVRACVPGEGSNWHRTKWAAQNYACQVRNMRVRELRDELDRVERMDFGVKR